MMTALEIAIVTCPFLFPMRSHIDIMSIAHKLRDDHRCRARQETDTARHHCEGNVAQVDTEIIGALLGAIVGAFAGAAVSRWSIRYDRQMAACSAMQALADEARFNAHVVRHLQEDVSGYSPSALERQAFDAALPVLYVLPPALRDRSRDARSRILIMMHLEEILETSLTKPDAPPTSVVQKRHELTETLPKELDSLADEIASFVKTDCESQWFGSRSASPH
jgi:hypothetical protein